MAPRPPHHVPRAASPTPSSRALVTVRVRPRAARPGVRAAPDATLEVSVSAPPVDGAANAEITRLVAAWLGVPPTRVEVWRGERSRTKVLCVRELDPRELARRLEAPSP